MLKNFERSIRMASIALAIVGGAAIVLMMAQTTLDVLMNNILGRPIKGNIEFISNYYMVIVVFFPLALIELRHEHINADFLVNMFPSGLKRIVYAFNYLICLLFFGILTYQTLLDAVKSWKINEILMGDLYLPIWPAKFALPIGFLMISLAVILHMLKALTDPGFEPVPAEPEVPNSPEGRS